MAVVPASAGSVASVREDCRPLDLEQYVKAPPQLDLFKIPRSSKNKKWEYITAPQLLAKSANSQEPNNEGCFCSGQRQKSCPIAKDHFACGYELLRDGIRKRLLVGHTLKSDTGQAANTRCIYAEEAISEGCFVMEYIGEVLTDEQVTKRETNAEQLYRGHGGNKCSFDIPHTSWVIDPVYKGNVARFLNHSCDPNLEAELIHVCSKEEQDMSPPRIAFFATKDISLGEEVSSPLVYVAGIVMFVHTRIIR